VENDEVRARFEVAWGAPIPAKEGLHLSGMFDAMEHGELSALYVIGENPAQSEADRTRAVGLLEGLDHLVVQDIFRTKTAELGGRRFPRLRVLGRGGGHGHVQ